MSSLKGWNHYVEGMHIEWPFSFSVDSMRKYAILSGDFNPIHLDADFARSKGFDATLVYGLLLSSQMSRLIGQELPDKNAFLITIQMDFIQPAYPDDRLLFQADLINKSDATYFLDFKCRVMRGEITICRGMAGAVWRA